jgi:CBS domain containing-hemolysin-like protein
VGVRDGDRLDGWVSAADLDGHSSVGEVTAQAFAAVFHRGTTLKAALDGIVTSRTRVAVVLDEADRYRGMLTLDDLAEGIVR